MEKNEDLLKTVGAIVLIAVIVVTTFLFGDHQRQVQLRNDQAKAAAAAKTTSAQTAAATATPAANKPAATTPATTPTTKVTATVPTSTPSTGGEIGYLIPATAILVAYQYTRKSKRSLDLALRAR